MTAAPRCLLVEDQALIGMALEASLEEAGFDVAGTFATGASALRWLEKNKPELALVDVMLKDGPAVRVARELKRQGVPFAVYSGLSRDAATPEFEGVPWLEKPVSRQALADVLARLAQPCSLGADCG